MQEQSKSFEDQYLNRPAGEDQKMNEGKEGGRTEVSGELKEDDVREGRGYDAYTSDDAHVSDRKDEQSKLNDSL